VGGVGEEYGLKEGKRTSLRDSVTRFFASGTFPQAPDNDIRVISNFFGDIPKSRCTTGINDTG
jgi:hypothetical protein